MATKTKTNLTEAQHKALKDLVAEKGPFKLDTFYPNGDILVTMKTKAQFFITATGRVFKEVPKRERFVRGKPGDLFEKYAEQVRAERGMARPVPGQRQLFQEA